MSGSPTSSSRALCILDLDNTLSQFFHHLPHNPAAQSIYPCWPWFVSQNATDRCGFALMDRCLSLRPWVLGLVEAMGCTHNLVTEEQAGTGRTGWPNIYASKAKKPPKPKSGLPGDPVMWFPLPNAAEKLRERVVGIEDPPNGLKVGFIQREETRRIENFQVRVREERSDDALRILRFLIASLLYFHTNLHNANNAVHDVATASSAIISNAVNTLPLVAGATKRIGCEAARGNF